MRCPTSCSWDPPPALYHGFEKVRFVSAVNTPYVPHFHRCFSHTPTPLFPGILILPLIVRAADAFTPFPPLFNKHRRVCSRCSCYSRVRCLMIWCILLVSFWGLKSMTRSRALHKLLCDFQEAATAGAVAISDVRMSRVPHPAAFLRLSPLSPRLFLPALLLNSETQSFISGFVTVVGSMYVGRYCFPRASFVTNRSPPEPRWLSGESEKFLNFSLTLFCSHAHGNHDKRNTPVTHRRTTP